MIVPIITPVWMYAARPLKICVYAKIDANRPTIDSDRREPRVRLAERAPQRRRRASHAQKIALIDSVTATAFDIT